MTTNLSPALPCDNGWTSVSTACYFFGTQKREWGRAKTICEGSALKIAGLGRTGDEFWMGLTIASSGGSWKWQSSGRQLDGGFTKWVPGEPNGGSGPNCARMKVHDSQYKWADRQCSHDYFPLCEKRKTYINKNPVWIITSYCFSPLLPVPEVPGFMGCFSSPGGKGLTRPHEDEIPIMTEVWVLISKLYQ